MPEVSVVLPTYNRVEFLSRSIESVLKQSFNDLEVVVVDDSPGNEVKRVIDDMNDARVQYIHSRNPQGVSHARNIGIQNAKGRFVAFLDDDDIWHLDKIEKQMKVFGSDQDCGLVYSAYRSIDKDGRVTAVAETKGEGGVFSTLLRLNIPGTSTVMVKRECLDKAGMFDTSIPACEDWDLWIRISQHCKFRAIDEVLVDYTVHEARLSSNKKGLIEGRAKLLAKHQADMDKATIAFHSHWIAVNHFLYGDKKKAREYEKKAIENDPHTRKYRITRMAFLLGRSLFRQYMKASGRLYE